jgi:hypothetical protein
MRWLRDHPGRAVSEANVAEIFALAYANAASNRNAVSAFSTTGIHPFNPDIFTDDDYAGADVSERPITSDPVASTSAAAAMMTSAVPDQTAPFVMTSTSAAPDFSNLISVPKSDRTSGASHSGRKRKAALAVLVTSSPFKQQLQDVEVEKKRNSWPCKIGNERRRKRRLMKARRTRRL